MRWRGTDRKNKAATSPERERVPGQIDAQCIGESCSNWKGQECASFMIWTSANATEVEDRDLSQPPFLDEALWVVYDQRCAAEPTDQPTVMRKVEVYQTPQGVMMELIGVTNYPDDVPVLISGQGISTAIIPSTDNL